MCFSINAFLSLQKTGNQNAKNVGCSNDSSQALFSSPEDGSQTKAVRKDAEKEEEEERTGLTEMHTLDAGNAGLQNRRKLGVLLGSLVRMQDAVGSK